jgi:hypothetical protein
MFGTHKITYYGGNRENVRILVDRTEMRDFGLYGTMLVEVEKPLMLGHHTKWVQFGIYNATGIECLKPGVLDAPCHMGLKLPVSG